MSNAIGRTTGRRGLGSSGLGLVLSLPRREGVHELLGLQLDGGVVRSHRADLLVLRGHGRHIGGRDRRMRSGGEPSGGLRDISPLSSARHDAEIRTEGAALGALGVGRDAAGGGGGGAKLSPSSAHASAGALLATETLPRPGAGEGADGTGRGALGMDGFEAAGAGGGAADAPERRPAMSGLPIGL